MNKFQKLYRIQCQRLKDKGIVNIAIAITLLCLILKGAHVIGLMIWPTQISNRPLFVIFGSIFIHLFCQFLYFLVYLPGYLKKSSFYQLFRINKGILRAWQKPSTWPQTRKRLFTYLGINYFIIFPIMVTLTNMAGTKVRFQDFPSLFQITWQLLFVYFVQDTFFYWAHRISHQSKFLYKYHKIHHEYTQVFSLVTQFTHPVDFVFGNLMPSAIPFIILGSRAHCFMFFFWQVWKIWISTQGHSGYEFPWTPTRIFFFISGPSFHDFHHSRNAGNYCGSAYLWDHFNDTADQYFQYRYPQLKEKSKGD